MIVGVVIIIMTKPIWPTKIEMLNNSEMIELRGYNYQLSLLNTIKKPLTNQLGLLEAFYLDNIIALEM